MKLIGNLSDLDRAATREFGIAGLTLMENAGQQVATAVQTLLANKPEAMQASIIILCGPGNNGGDGFVCARLLAQAGYTNVEVLLFPGAADSTGDAASNRSRLAEVAISVKTIVALPDIQPLLEKSDVVIDGLFGSGLARPVTGVFREAIEFLNAMPQHARPSVIAVDMPSGVSSETGEILGAALRADSTITFAVGKPGLYVYPGKGYAGDVQVVSIGLPEALVEADLSPFSLITPKTVAALLPRRAADSHKNSFHKILILAGSRLMPGAAALASEAALRTGAGYVTLAATHSLFTQISIRPEVVRLPLPETQEGMLDNTAISQLQVSLAQHGVLVIGPGLGLQAATADCIHQLLASLIHKPDLPVVLDADALTLLARWGPKDSLPNSGRFILTPHVGEAARLLEKPTEKISGQLLAHARQLSEHYHATVVLKSASSIVATPNGQLAINTTGNPGMATAGSGDVLTGIIAGLLSQHLSAIHAVQLGVCLHGLAGDIAAQHLTPYSLLAGDIIEALPKALNQMLNDDVSAH